MKTQEAKQDPALRDEAKRRVDIAAAKLAIRLPFIATIFSGMRREIDDVGTACVKGMHVRFDPRFVSVLDDEELMFVCAHEAEHTCYLHSYRMGDRDPRIWNYAGDAMINPELISAGLKMPRWDATKVAAYPEEAKKAGAEFGVLVPWVTPDMTVEEVYKRLLEEAEKQPKPKPGKGKPGQGATGEQEKGGWANQGDLEADDGKEGDGESEAEVKTMIAQAARTAFASGDKSEMIKRILGVVQQSEIDWKDETRSMLADPNRNDYSYRRYSRRFIYQGIYLPSLYSEDLGTLGVGVDVSGSMTDGQLAKIQNELRTIIEDCSPERTVVVYCHSNICRVDTFEKGDELVLEMPETGGTDMRKIVDYFNEYEGKLAGVIIFTDLETPFPEQEPPYPFLWGAVGARSGIQPPVGRVVEVKV